MWVSVKKSLCLLLVLLLLPHGYGLAATVTPDELTQLEQTFRELKHNNEILLGDSTKSQQDLIRALQLLRESQDELKKLQTQLVQLKQESMTAKSELSQANDSLKQVSESLKQLEKERKREILKYKIISAVLIVGCGALAFR